MRSCVQDGWSLVLSTLLLETTTSRDQFHRWRNTHTKWIKDDVIVFVMMCIVIPFTQEPYNWPTVANVSRKYLAIRYSLLPYYYTLFYKAHRKVDSANPPAATIVRPLFFEFPQDTHTYPIDWQFMLGSALLFTPVLRVGELVAASDFSSISFVSH